MPQGGVILHMYSADLARYIPTGNGGVLADLQAAAVWSGLRT